MDPKPHKRFRATAHEWNVLRRTFHHGYACAVCEEPWRELHHLYARGQGGDDVFGNLVPLCSGCHRQVEARDPVARAKVRGWLTEPNRWYLTYRLGHNAQGWLDRNYPELAA